MSVIVTGVAGFIGSHVAKALLARGEKVAGIDNVNDYYSVALKRARLAQLAPHNNFEFNEIDIADPDAVGKVVARHADATGVIHLAAQAGVRYSLINPYAYVTANVMGQVVMLEAARRLDRLKCFVYASSS
jgi:UDP-glucuronate 4-epimerase